MKIPKYKKLLLVVGVLLALLIVKIVLFFTVKPKVTVDYVAQFNKLSHLQNYDPNKNAAPYYQKAFDAYVEMPAELQKLYVNWPSDFNNTEEARLTEWLLSNSQAVECFKAALNKPYYWLERKAEKDNLVADIRIPELLSLRQLTEVLIWNAKIKAVKGQFRPAFEDILICYRTSNHKCQPNLLTIDQCFGLGIRQTAVENALVILDKSKIESEALKFLQDALQSECDQDTYVPSIRTEKFSFDDALQRLFIDNGKGTGRLAWSVGWYITLCAELDKSPFQREYESLKRRLYCCIIGPTRNETAIQIEQVIAMSDQMMAKTPWQVKNEGSDLLKEIQNINKSNFFWEILAVNSEGPWHLYYKTKAQTDALIAVLAILRYKNDSGQFPESLDKLVSAGYLKALPQDPYSNGTLIYKPTETNFKLYSVGPDFKDDGGSPESNNVSISKYPGMPGMDLHAQPRNLDIVYWPVINWKEKMLKTVREQQRQYEEQKRMQEANSR